MKKITKLEFYKQAKKHFSKKEYKLDSVRVKTFPVALCYFLSIFRQNKQISETNFFDISKKIDVAVKESVSKVEKNYPTFYQEFSTAYFVLNSDRLKFINKQIKDLTKK